MIRADRAEFEGYASVFGRVDLSGDRILPGAFGGKLIPAQISQVRMLYQHQAEAPIGRWTDIREDHHGLFVRGELFLDTADGVRVHRLVKGGAIDGLSIGFKTAKANADRRGRVLAKVDLWEISIVTFPMSPTARILRTSEAGERLPRNLLAA